MARLVTGWHADPKVLQAGLTGMGLHAWSISYCDHTLSDGFVPMGAWPALPGVGAAVKALVVVGLWERVEGGFQVHDYLDYNRSRAQVEGYMAAKAAAGRAGGLAKAKAHALAPAVAEALANGQRKPTPGPGPGPGDVNSPPNPSQPNPGLARARAKPRDVDLSRDWQHAQFVRTLEAAGEDPAVIARLSMPPIAERELGGDGTKENSSKRRTRL